jgi:hypothetical protein
MEEWEEEQKSCKYTEREADFITQTLQLTLWILWCNVGDTRNRDALQRNLSWSKKQTQGIRL